MYVHGREEGDGNYWKVTLWHFYWPLSAVICMCGKSFQFGMYDNGFRNRNETSIYTGLERVLYVLCKFFHTLHRDFCSCSVQLSVDRTLCPLHPVSQYKGLGYTNLVNCFDIKSLFLQLLNVHTEAPMQIDFQFFHFLSPCMRHYSAVLACLQWQ